MSIKDIHMSDDEYKKIVILSSGYYLTEALPDDFFEMSEEDQDQFMEDNCWQPFEYWDVKEVYAVIDSASYATKTFVNKDRQELAVYIRDAIQKELDNGAMLHQALDDATIANALELYSKGDR